MKIKEVTLKEVPVYKDPGRFYQGGGKGLYQQFRQTFPHWPEQVANDIYNQTSPGTNPDIMTLIKNGTPAAQVFLDYFTAKKTGRDAGTGLTTEQLKKVFLDGKWTRKILEVNPGNFTTHTLDRMKKRNFLRTPGSDEDPARMARAQQAARATAAKGSNEPVTVIKTQQGLVLWEGFHRTMSILAQGENGNPDPTKWNPVKLQAWVVEV
jgi:hypothetical protein